MSLTQRLYYFLKVLVRYSLYMCAACRRDVLSNVCQSTLDLVHCLLSLTAQILPVCTNNRKIDVLSDPSGYLRYFTTESEQRKERLL